MDKNTNGYAAAYQAALLKGNIQVAYERLIKFVMAVRTHFDDTTVFRVGNVSPGYLDYTYFSFFDDFLRSKKLRFGIVLNHAELRFELWLMGQNADIQRKYWNIFKESQWNRHLAAMPKYSVLEVVINDSPDFNNPNDLIHDIKKKALLLVDQIMPNIT